MKITGTRLRLTAAASLACGLSLATVPSTSAATPTAGSLIYITPTGAVDITSVSSSGATTTPQQVGPVSTVTTGETVTVESLTASNDGVWAAWAERVITSNDQPDVSDLLVARNNNTATEYTVKTLDDPVGFAGDKLVASDGVGAFELVLTPKPHLVSLHDGTRLLGVYSKGLIDSPTTFPDNKKSKVIAYEHVRIRSFSGAKRTIHTYADEIHHQVSRSIELTAPSGDGKQLLVERGDKTDFGGVGPSSNIDELALTGKPHAKHLGHYGTGAAQWRAWTETYVGPSDGVWVTWYSAHTAKVRSVVTRYVGGHWQLVAANAVTAVGNAKGYVVLQPGTFTLVANSPANEHEPTPTTAAILVHRGRQQALDIKGSSFAWISKAFLPV